MYYKRKKAEREAAEKGVSPEGCTDNVNDINTAASSDENDTPSCSPRGSQGEPVGPVGKFLRFCENLEKEVEKARVTHYLSTSILSDVEEVYDELRRRLPYNEKSKVKKGFINKMKTSFARLCDYRLYSIH